MESTRIVETIDSIALLHDLHASVRRVGIEFLAAFFASAPSSGLEHDSIALGHLLELLGKLAKDEAPPYVSFAPPLVLNDDKFNNEQPYMPADAMLADLDKVLKDNVNGHSEVVDSEYYKPSEEKHEDDDDVEVRVDNPPSVVEVLLSKTAFPELFPTIETTKKKQLTKSFPHIDEFEGGIHILGSGNFGLTFKSVLRGVRVVLKVSKKRSEEANRADYHEWSVSERLNEHPNVLQISGLCPSFGSPFFRGVGTTALIAPLQENGGLKEFFGSREARDDDILDIAFGMIAGIRSLHEQRVVHRDIAVRNFLVNCDGRVLICDFGLTEFLPAGSDVLHGSSDESLPWRSLAPESHALVFSTKSDVWMYGLALVELVTGRSPWPEFRTFDALKEAFAKKELELPAMADFHPVIAAIVRDCLQFDPSERPTANEVAERLVRWQFRETDLNRDQYGNTELHQMITGHYERYIDELLHTGSPVMVNAVNHLGETPLMRVKNVSNIKSLLKYRKVPSNNEEPSRIAECFHNIDVFGTLRELAEKQYIAHIKLIGESDEFVPAVRSSKREKRLGANGETPLHIAAKIGNIALFDALMKLKVISVWKSDNDGRTALHVASLNGHAGIMEKLIALTGDSKENGNLDVHRVNTQDKIGKTPLHLAATSGNVSAVRVLLACSAINVNQRDFDQRTPMFDVLLADYTDASSRNEVFQAFADHVDIDLHANDSTGESILHKCARQDLAQSVEFLLKLSDMHLSMFVREKEHKHAPIHLSVREKSFRVASILLAKWNRDVNERDKYGNTLLHLLAAAYFPPTDTSDKAILIKRSAMLRFAETLVTRDDIDLNLCNLRGDTPLHVAIEKNNLTIVEMFLSAPGGNLRINECDKRGRTPLLLALDGDKADIAKLILLRKDVDVNVVEDILHETPLHLSSVNNTPEITRVILMKSDVDVDARDRLHRTPLLRASEYNASEVAIMLISRDDVDVNAHDNGQQTSLHWASRANATKIATFLLSRDDVDVNAHDHEQQTPLHWASMENADEVAALLLQRDDVDVSARDDKQRTPLHWASARNAAEVAALLLSRDVDVNARDIGQRTPLHKASECEATKVAALLLSRDDVDVNTRDDRQQTPLHWASMTSATEVAALLLARDDVDVNVCDKRQQTPLHWASRKNHDEVAALLLARDNVDVNARDAEQKTPLHKASECKSTEVAALLLAKDDVDVNVCDKRQRTPLHWASRKNHDEVAALLLARDNVDVNARDAEQKTPLHVASQYNVTEVAALLLAKDDVDVNARDIGQKTPLHIASERGAVEVAAVLISRDDVDVNAQNVRQQTPLHIASLHNNLKVVTMLISRDDVDVNARDERQRTPLHAASWGTHYRGAANEVMAILLSRDDVDVGARDADGKTALEIATAKDATECVELLRAAS